MIYLSRIFYLRSFVFQICWDLNTAMTSEGMSFFVHVLGLLRGSQISEKHRKLSEESIALRIIMKVSSDVSEVARA